MALLNPANFNTLSIRGGGIKAIVPCYMLAELERQTNMKCNQLFSFFAGTSTGAIVAYALSQGIAAEDIISFYLERGPYIFQRRLPTYLGLRGPKYSLDRLQKSLHGVFANSSFVGGTPCMVCTSNTDWNKAFMFKNWKEEFRDVMAWEALSASCAATSFFAAVHVKGLGRFADGGFWANNPAIFAMTQAKRLREGKPTDLLVDLGCPMEIAREHSELRGVIDITGIISSMMECGMNASEFVCWDELGANYVAQVPSLGLASSAMDDVSKENMANLVSAGKQQKMALARKLL